MSTSVKLSRNKTATTDISKRVLIVFADILTSPIEGGERHPFPPWPYCIGLDREFTTLQVEIRIACTKDFGMLGD